MKRIGMCLALSIGFCFVAPAEDKPKPDIKPAAPAPSAGPKMDAAKYPQDTPEKALDSIVKALNAGDFGYFIAWLITPDSTKRTLDKFKTLDAAVEDQKTSEAKIAGRKGLLDAIQKVQKDPKKTEDKDDKGIVRFATEGDNFIQMEKQKDGGWCVNPRARSAAK